MLRAGKIAAFLDATRHVFLRARRKLAKYKRRVLTLIGLYQVARPKYYRKSPAAASGERNGGTPAWRSRAPFLLSLPGEVDSGTMAAVLREQFPGALEETIAEAERIRRGEFSLFGGTEKHRLSGGADWHLDVSSGYRWPAESYYTAINLSPAGDRRDVRVTWELNRFHHAVTLGKAYWLTGEDKYASEFASEVLDWLEANPVNYGVNWSCGMEVAIRAVNLAAAYRLMRGAKALTGAFAERFLAAIQHHALFILDNLEFGLPSGNHLLFDAAGLVLLGLSFPELKGARRWVRRGLSILWTELDRQFSEDGVNFEGATAYHALVCELCLIITAWCETNGQRIPSHARAKIERSCEFLGHCLKPDGSIVRFGDDDDGRLLVFSERERREKTWYRSVLAVAAVMFERPDFRAAVGPFTEGALWFLGPEGLRRYEALSGREPGRPGSRGFIQGGYYFMRHETRHERVFMAIDGADIGMNGAGGHGHNDVFGFEVVGGSDTLIVDPGTFVYSADEATRNWFRGAFAHNVFTVDGQEIARFVPGKLWSVADVPRVRLRCWRSTAEYDLFDAEHDGYERLRDPVRCRRRILFVKNGGRAGGFWLIRDVFAGRGTHSFRLNICLGVPRVSLRRDLGGAVVGGGRGTGAFGVLIVPVGPARGRYDPTLSRTWVSPRYGEKRRAIAAQFQFVAEVPTEFALLVVLFPKDEPPPDARDLQELVRRAGAIERIECGHEDPYGGSAGLEQRFSSGEPRLCPTFS